MAARVVRGRSRSFSRGARPGGTWARSVLTPTAIGADTKVLRTTFALSNSGIGETIRRSVGHMYVRSDQVAATEDWRGAFGMIVVSDLAIAAGAASIPGPVTDANDDGWFVWQAFNGAQGIDSQLTGHVFTFDSRAMRRVEEGFTVAMMIEATGVGVLLGLSLSMYSTRH